MIHHPLPADLMAFAAGQLSPFRSREIDLHLISCEECSSAIVTKDMQSVPNMTSREVTPEGPLVPPGYTFIEEVGRGGMGVVYRVRRKSDNVEVVIKTLLPQHRNNSTVASYLQHEARITAQVRNIRVLHSAQLRQYSEVDPTPYIEFTWVPGTTLARMIGTPLAREHPLPLVRWVAQCCRAVEAAHRQLPPIVHFDLKPENLLIYNSDSEAVLIDFGLASPWPPPYGTSRTGCGTPNYMAPELADEAREHLIGPATDVFAIGGMLCAILTGQPPYSRADFPGLGEVREAARRADLAQTMKRLDHCHEYPELVAFTKKCLAVDPANRPADAGVARRELERLLDSSLPSRVNRVPRRYRAIGYASITILAACLVLALTPKSPSTQTLSTTLTPTPAPTPTPAITPPPTPESIITVKKWVLYFLSDGHFMDKDGNPIVEHDKTGISKMNVGAYPQIEIHDPERIAKMSLQHNAILSYPIPHNSDFTVKVPKLPRASIPIQIPDEPGFSTGINNHQVCKQPLTLTVALSNRQYIEPRNMLFGGLGAATESQFNLMKRCYSGLNQTCEGATYRAMVCCERLQAMWNEASAVKLYVQLHGVKEPYEYDITPSRLGWEEGIRHSEAN